MTGAFFKIFPAHFHLHTFAMVVMHNRGMNAAGELEFGRDPAGLEVLVTLQIEQWIFIVRVIELLGHIIDDHIVPIFAAKPVIAVGRDDMELLVLDPHDGHVERAAAEIEDKNGLIMVELVEPIGECRRRRLIDNLENVESGELTGRDRGRALGVVEISRHRYDSVRHRLVEISLRVHDQLLHDEGGEFFSGINLPAEFAVKLLLRFADFALHKVDNLLRLDHGVIFRMRPNNNVRAVKQDDRWRDSFTLGIGDDLRFAVGIKVRYGRESGSEIDSDCFAMTHVWKIKMRM